MCADQKSKSCKICGEEKNISTGFYKNQKGYYNNSCKVCIGNKGKKRFQDNKHEIAASRREYQKEYRKKNKDKERFWTRSWVENNREKRRLINREHYHRNQKKRLANGRRYYARKLKATPIWLTKEHLQQMMEIYCNCPEGCHVDHIIPLKGKEVCGLHVPWNLQYLPAKENMRKNNRI